MDSHDKQPEAPAPAQDTQDRISSLEDASKTLNHFGVIIFFVILVEVILLFGLNLYQKSRFNTLSAELDTLRGTLSSAEYKTLNDQVEEVISGAGKLDIVLSSKVRWSNFYTQLNAITPKDVKLGTINIGSDGSFKAEGETASLTSLARALVGWNQGTPSVATPFSSIKLNSNGFIAKDGGKRVSFTISGQINIGRIR
ncbi:MAG: hypothetical protein WEC83_02270 [Patescibacteria group bacterium]